MSRIELKEGPTPGLSLAVSKVTILRNGGADKVSFWLDAPSPYRVVEELATATVHVPEGSAERWLERLGVDVSKIETVVSKADDRTKFSR